MDNGKSGEKSEVIFVKITHETWYHGFTRRGNVEENKFFIMNIIIIVAIVASVWIFLGPECLLFKCVVVK